MLGMGSYRRICFLIAFGSSLLIHGQESNSLIESLSSKTFNELLDLYNNEPKLYKRKNILSIYLKKAKKEKNTSQLMTGYQISAMTHNNEKALIYSDSIIAISKPIDSHFDTSSAYQIKGEFYYKKRDYINALNNFIEAKEYALKSKNKYLIFYNNLSIGVIKDLIGEHSEALKIHKENLNIGKEYIKGKDNESYLQSIYAIAFSYNHLKQVDSATYYNNFGIKESVELKNSTTKIYFVLNQGVTHYYKKEYKNALDSLHKSIKPLKAMNDQSNLSEAYFYISQSYIKKNDEINALVYLKKVDSIFLKEKYLYPELRKSYEYLIKYYKKNDSLSQELIYVNRLISLDSILHLNNLYLNKQIIKEYDIPILIAEKQSIIDKMEKKTLSYYKSFFIIGFLVFMLIIILFVQFNKKRIYKKRFEEIINKSKEVTITNTIEKNKSLNISKDIIDDVLNKLEKFEKTKAYLSKKVTLNSLAKDFNTNSNYLSKIINHNKNKSFSNYLNTLRIEHIITILKSNSTIRKYTIKAVADEAGFSNSESFSKAFYKTKGIKPSYFIKQIDRNKT